jgi:zinc transporter ZupT
MLVEVLPFIFAVIIGITYYFSNKVDISRKSNSHKILSFSAGVSITYVLLELFPSFTEVAFSINKLLFLSILLGFIVHHLIEKEIYQHNRNHELIRLLSLQENIFSYVYHVILGIVLVSFTQQNLIQGWLLFIPVLSFTLVSALPSEPHIQKSKSLFIASSTLVGVGIGWLWTSRSLGVEFFLVGLVTGVLLYTVIRHHIPFGAKGHVSYFTLGFLLYAAFIVSTWYI